jgi:hypothetical protein
MPTDGPTPPRRKKRRTQRPAIGWREWVALPDLGVDAIKAKVDTGARSSSLHAFDLERFETGGRAHLRFTVHPTQRRAHPTVPVEVPLLRDTLVRNPGGREEVRPVIRTTVSWNGELWEVELNLTRRDEMGFRMLLGRQAVRRRFLVDPGRSFLGGALDGEDT